MYLSDEKFREAMTYNENQGFSNREILMIQKTLEVKEKTGSWNEQTIYSIARFQEGNGITPDGKIWRSNKGDTWPFIRYLAIETAEIDESIELGVWCDCLAKNVLKKKYFRKLKSLNIKTLALMINESNTIEENIPFKVRWKKSELKKAANLAEEFDINLVYTVWPRPDKNLIDEIFIFLKNNADLRKLKAIEMDAEGNWDVKFLKGFKDMLSASNYLNRMLDDFCKNKIRKDLTTFPAHKENCNQAQLSKYMDCLFPQAYSVRNRKNHLVSISHRLGPGNLQNWALSRTELVPNFQNKILGCGLSIYDQYGFEGLSPEEALYLAARTAVVLGATELKFWSSKYLLGKMANNYSENFFKSLKKERKK
jgi:hypothetical protein